MGIPDEVVAHIEGGSGEHDFEVWRDNWPTLLAFLAVSTQWKVATLGGGLEAARIHWIGLDYAAVAAGLQGHGIVASADTWTGLRIMEAAAKNTLNGMAETD